MVWAAPSALALEPQCPPLWKGKDSPPASERPREDSGGWDIGSRACPRLALGAIILGVSGERARGPQEGWCAGARTSVGVSILLSLQNQASDLQQEFICLFRSSMLHPPSTPLISKLILSEGPFLRDSPPLNWVPFLEDSPCVLSRL